MFVYPYLSPFLCLSLSLFLWLSLPTLYLFVSLPLSFWCFPSFLSLFNVSFTLLLSFLVICLFLSFRCLSVSLGVCLFIYWISCHNNFSLSLFHSPFAICCVQSPSLFLISLLFMIFHILNSLPHPLFCPPHPTSTFNELPLLQVSRIFWPSVLHNRNVTRKKWD